MLQWLITQNIQWHFEPKFVWHWNLLGLLYYYHYNKNEFWANISEIYNVVIGTGNRYSKLEWLNCLQHPEGKHKWDGWNGTAYTVAALNDKFWILKWLRSRIPIVKWEENGITCKAAAQKNNLKVLQWLRNQNPPCPWKRRAILRHFQSIENTEAIDWVSSQDNDGDDDNDDNDDGYDDDNGDDNDNDDGDDVGDDNDNEDGDDDDNEDEDGNDDDDGDDNDDDDDNDEGN
jgi:hypothetical protein